MGPLIALIPLRAWLVGGAMALAIGGALYLGHRLEAAGEQRAIDRINAANKSSEEKADAGEKAIWDCRRLGGSWDRFERVCKPAGQ